MPSRKLKTTALSAALLVAAAALIAFAAYLISLDRQIRQYFAGARWELPAQVFASPLELYTGLPMGREALQRELERLGYRAAAELQGPGTYVSGKGGLQLQSRAFQFWDATQPSLQLGVKWGEDGLVSEVFDLEAGAPRDIVRLDPMLIGSIYPRQGEDRVLVKLADVPELLPKGLIAVEDRGFYSHFGVSPKAIFWSKVGIGDSKYRLPIGLQRCRVHAHERGLALNARSQASLGWSRGSPYHGRYLFHT